MRAVVQRVKKANVCVDQQEIANIPQGFVVLLGISADDSEDEAKYLAKKISNLRIFNDEQGKMTYSLQQVDGQILSISQFTLIANVKKGNRPNFAKAMQPDRANELYQKFNQELEQYLPNKIQTGIFGADMQVELINDGPVTIIYDTKEG